MTTRTAPGTRPATRWLAWALLLSGVVLTAGDFVLVFLLVFTASPDWLWSLLSVLPWGPIALLIGALLHRHHRRVQRIWATGVAGRATLRSIGETSIVVNDRPVLRLTVSVSVTGQPVYDTTVRNAPPSHLVGMLRPGVSIPVMVDAEEPARIVIDWATAEAETSPIGNGGTP